MPTIKPLSNHLVVQHLPYKVPDGIVIPEAFAHVMQEADTKVFKVVAVGPGRVTRKGIRVPIECEPGDRIITKSYTAGPDPLPDGNFLIDDGQILAVIPQQTYETQETQIAQASA